MKCPYKFYLILALSFAYSIDAKLEHVNEPSGDTMKVNANFSSAQIVNYDLKEDIIDNYFKNFEILSKAEKWEEILAQGSKALEAAKKSSDISEAKICAQLTSTSFYLGNYELALSYASRCHELSEKFEDPTLFIRALYLEAAVYRALAAKEMNEEAKAASYLRAVLICEEAFQVYLKMSDENINLKGKIYFNLGAAHADNPKGDLKKAVNCYNKAIECFKNIKASNDVIRTMIRLGKVYLLEKNDKDCQRLIKEVRSLITCKRLSMHADYLEAQLKFSINECEEAFKIAKTGLEKAKSLGAKEDESRLMHLLQNIEKVISNV